MVALSKLTVDGRYELVLTSNDHDLLTRLASDRSPTVRGAFVERQRARGDVSGALWELVLDTSTCKDAVDPHRTRDRLLDDLTEHARTHPLPDATLDLVAANRAIAHQTHLANIRHGPPVLTDDGPVYAAVHALNVVDVDLLTDIAADPDPPPAFLDTIIAQPLSPELAASDNFCNALNNNAADDPDLRQILKLIACQNPAVRAMHASWAENAEAPEIPPIRIVQHTLGEYHKSNQPRDGIKAGAQALWEALDFTDECSVARRLVAEHGQPTAVFETDMAVYIATPDAIRAINKASTPAYTYVHLDEGATAHGGMSNTSFAPALGYHKETGPRPDRPEDTADMIVWPVPLKPAVYNLSTGDKFAIAFDGVVALTASRKVIQPVDIPTPMPPDDRSDKSASRFTSTSFEPGNLCPHCHALIDPLPKANRKCPDCRGWIRVRKNGNGDVLLLTDEQAEAFAAERDRFHRHRDLKPQAHEDFGVSSSQWDAMLAADPDKDSVDLFVEYAQGSVDKAAAKHDLHTAAYDSFKAALALFNAGRDFLPMRRAGLRYRLQDEQEKAADIWGWDNPTFRINGIGGPYSRDDDPRDLCRVADGQPITVDEILGDNPPLPHLYNDGRWCPCGILLDLDAAPEPDHTPPPPLPTAAVPSSVADAVARVLAAQAREGDSYGMGITYSDEIFLQWTPRRGTALVEFGSRDAANALTEDTRQDLDAWRHKHRILDTHPDFPIWEAQAVCPLDSIPGLAAELEEIVGTADGHPTTFP